MNGDEVADSIYASVVTLLAATSVYQPAILRKVARELEHDAKDKGNTPAERGVLWELAMFFHKRALDNDDTTPQG